MKPWMKKSLFGFVGASLALGALSGCSNGHGWRHGEMDGARMTEMRGRIVDRVSGKLELDAAQRQKLDVLADRLQAQRSAFAGKAGQPRAAVQALVAGAQFDRAGAQAMVDARVQAVQQGGPEVIAALGDFYDSLRPEQQQKLRDWMQRRHGWSRWG